MRGSTPQRIYEARRAAVMSRYRNLGRWDDETIDRWVSAWEDHATKLGRVPFTSEFWDGAPEWIDARRHEL